MEAILANVVKQVEKACENSSLDADSAGMQKINIDFVDGVLQVYKKTKKWEKGENSNPIYAPIRGGAFLYIFYLF